MPRFAERTCAPSRTFPFALACTLLASCMSAPNGAGYRERTCDDSALGWAVGTRFDDAAYARLLRESGAGLLNPIGPNSTVRGDSRGDRLRVYLDKDNIVTAVRCE
jgi:hypothetical protein